MLRWKKPVVGYRSYVAHLTKMRVGSFPPWKARSSKHVSRAPSQERSNTCGSKTLDFKLIRSSAHSPASRRAFQNSLKAIGSLFHLMMFPIGHIVRVAALSAALPSKSCSVVDRSDRAYDAQV